MTVRRFPESGPQRITPPGMEDYALEIRFEEMLMEGMGVQKHDNAAALAWIKRYANAFRTLVESDAELRALMASDPPRAVQVARERLAPVPGAKTAVA